KRVRRSVGDTGDLDLLGGGRLPLIEQPASGPTVLAEARVLTAAAAPIQPEYGTVAVRGNEGVIVRAAVGAVVVLYGIVGGVIVKWQILLVAIARAAEQREWPRQDCGGVKLCHRIAVHIVAGRPRDGVDLRRAQAELGNLVEEVRLFDIGED